MNDEQRHLNLISIFHYIVGGLLILFGLCPSMHLVMGILFLLGGMTCESGEGPPPSEDAMMSVVFGVMFVIFPIVWMLGCWSLATLSMFAARFLSKRRRYKFCFFVACLLCMFMPFGTVLGVITLILLTRDSVKQLFEEQPDSNPDAT